MDRQDSSTLHGAGVHRDRPHDTTKTHRQVRRNRQLQNDPLQESLPYSEVHCLQFLWQETDINPGGDFWDLRSCLEFGLFWNVAKHEIPTVGSNTYVKTTVDGLIKLHGNKRNALLVIFYAGHSCVENGHMFWTGYDQHSSRMIRIYADSLDLMQVSIGDLSSKTLGIEQTPTFCSFLTLATPGKLHEDPKPYPTASGIATVMDDEFPSRRSLVLVIRKILRQAKEKALIRNASFNTWSS